MLNNYFSRTQILPLYCLSIDVNDTLLFAPSFSHLGDLPRKGMVGPNRMWKKNRIVSCIVKCGLIIF